MIWLGADGLGVLMAGVSFGLAVLMVWRAMP